MSIPDLLINIRASAEGRAPDDSYITLSYADALALCDEIDRLQREIAHWRSLFNSDEIYHSQSL